jgi:hypothetical protein
MRFQVPQFIEVEDKIFGPLTFKQFVYMAGGVGLSMIAWVFLPLFMAIPIILAAVALSFSLAFLKINEKPFIEVVYSAISYTFNHKLYIWNKEIKKVVKKEGEGTESAEIFVPKLSSSKLKELSWALDVEDISNRRNQEESGL